MNRFISVLVIFSFAICLLSCSYRGTYDDGYADGYSNAESEMQYLMEEEFLDGYDIGYDDGIAEAQHDIAFLVEDDLWSIACDIEAEYGLHPEEAVQILSNYADVPDEVDEAELQAAILAIYHYYYDSNEIINDIEDYWIG